MRELFIGLLPAPKGRCFILVTLLVAYAFAVIAVPVIAEAGSRLAFPTLVKIEPNLIAIFSDSRGDSGKAGDCSAGARHFALQ